jgi:hypothetical protein
MLEINVISLIVTGLVAIGLVGAQAALSRKNFVLTVSSAEKLSKEGYTREVIEALFFNEIEWVARTQSVIAAPNIASSNEKGLVSALADMLHMGELSLAMQQAIGKPPYRVWANFVTDSGEPHALVFGTSTRGDFQRAVASKGDTRVLVRAVAHAAVRAIDPYLMALHEFELGQNLAGIENLINVELARQRAPMLPLQQAAFHNLKGLVRLDKDDKQGALAEFDAAYAADPHFAIARVNRAFTLVALDRHPEAIATAQEVLATPAGGTIDQVVVAARMIIAVSKWSHGDQAGAEAEFVAAVKASPRNGAPLAYWMQMLNQTGRRDPAVEKLLTAARQNKDSAANELYAEIAMLYFWISNADKEQRVMRRVVAKPSRTDPDIEETPQLPTVGVRPPAAAK